MEVHPPAGEVRLLDVDLPLLRLDERDCDAGPLRDELQHEGAPHVEHESLSGLAKLSHAGEGYAPLDDLENSVQHRARGRHPRAEIPREREYLLGHGLLGRLGQDG